jgi:hypothetical protein
MWPVPVMWYDVNYIEICWWLDLLVNASDSPNVCTS